MRDERTPDRSLARTMIQRLAHRGPDSQAVHVEQHIALACARLSIVDLTSAANQPLTDPSGELTIVFNGEIYNFKEIRADLESRGHRFRSHSDTEVVLLAYRQWGPDCHLRFNGMWAFAIWDRPNRCLLLSRDRFGVKPLYVAEMPGRILFASEIKSLLAAGVPASLATEAFNRYCGGESMFERITPLAAGSYIEYRLDPAADVRRTWWTTTDHLVVPPKRHEERVEAFRELFVDAVRLRLRADVRPTVTLSGGLDSSSIYAAAQLLHRQKLAVTATDARPVQVSAALVTFPGSVIDETAFAFRVAEHFGERVDQVKVNPDDFRSLVERATWHQEALVWNVSVVVYHEFYRQLAKAGTRLVVEGHGADELLAGYANFAEDAVQQRVRSLRFLSAWSASQAASRTRNPLLGHRSRSPLFKIAAAVVRALFPKPRRHDARSIIDRNLLTGSAPPPHFAADMPELTPLKRALYAGFHSNLLPTVLRVNDRATMASGVESRAPFLDYRLVCFAFSIPEDDILGGWTKRILREAMQPFLPADIVWRKKKFGFLAPQPEWFRRPAVIAALDEALIDGTIARAPGVDSRRYAETLARGKLAGFTWPDSTDLWTAYSYAIWNDVFVTRSPSRAAQARSTST
ncbi:MAG: asparagine synthase (glutamine-hydrolyzing) [Acidobacteriota bacterium]|nr:asparagine synthase (glutamine-hydrolyzing) [Acidobacteriota bacterium]